MIILRKYWVITMNKDIKEKMYTTKDYFEFDDFLDIYFPEYNNLPIDKWNKEVKEYYIHNILGMTEEMLKDMETTITEYRDMEK